MDPSTPRSELEPPEEITPEAAAPRTRVEGFDVRFRLQTNLYEPGLNLRDPNIMYVDPPNGMELVSRRFTPYPVHHTLYLRQQMEQERRRNSLSPTSPPSRTSFRNPSYRRNLFVATFRIGARSSPSIEQTMSVIESNSKKKVATLEDCTDSCVICLSEYKEADEVRQLNCSHSFHKSCVDVWLLKKLICPVCRSDILEPRKELKCNSSPAINSETKN